MNLERKKIDWRKYNEGIVGRGKEWAKGAITLEGGKVIMDVNKVFLNKAVWEVTNKATGKLEHNDTVTQIERIFRTHGFFTTKEYPIFRMKDGIGRSGRIDLVARKGRFRIAIEYDHHMLIKWKSFQKIMQIKPEAAVAITGNGYLKPNLERAKRYTDKFMVPLYVVSLKQKRYEMLGFV
jgi:hypothetical protein